MQPKLSPENIEVGKTRQDDIIIALMGPTGSGKSHFIDALFRTAAQHQRAGSSLESCTKKTQAIRLRNHPRYGDRLVLVDTPGFNDTQKSDFEVLKLISDWLKKSYAAGVKLTGIAFFHRISDNRMAGTPHRNLRMFGELCGDKAAHNVVLVSTMWDTLERRTGEERERQLKQYFWKKMIEHGASVDRFENTSQSAWSIIDNIIERADVQEALLLQEEMVDLGMRLNETSAGMVLLDSLQRLMATQQRVLEELSRQQGSRNNPRDTAELRREYERLQEDLEKTFAEAKAMKISLPRRICLFFRRSKSFGSYAFIFLR
ncbi:hypothetical protein NLJ89_g3076 [Agrocybe chaxingu]|uniref:G domain-containing protein n=1 Tax=Agrocybe chaxingu TaxID=84603 RepID=A0A9W8KBJ8_9AGAR|nr:hypothetical protein NLJ89_g3076 [Agrocybe chaxingu]